MGRSTNQTKPKNANKRQWQGDNGIETMTTTATATATATTKSQLELLRQKYLEKLEPILDTVDAMLKAAATHEYELRTEIAQLKKLPAPPKPAMLTHWVRSSMFETQPYLQSVDAELSRVKTQSIIFNDGALPPLTQKNIAAELKQDTKRAKQ